MWNKHKKIKNTRAQNGLCVVFFAYACSHWWNKRNKHKHKEKCFLFLCLCLFHKCELGFKIHTNNKISAKVWMESEYSLCCFSGFGLLSNLNLLFCICLLFIVILILIDRLFLPILLGNCSYAGEQLVKSRHKNFNESLPCLFVVSWFERRFYC